MAAQRGKDLLLKVSNGQDPEIFVTVAGLRSKSITLNAETVDVTDSDSTEHWRELLPGGGIRSAAVAGSGIFRDVAADELLRSLFFAGTTRIWQIIVPGFGTIRGPFQITSLEYSGEYNGEATYNLALDSAGALSWTTA